MPSAQEPLLQRPPSQNSSDTRTGLEEEDALLTGQRTGKHGPDNLSSTAKRWREVGIFVWALLATAAVVVLAVVLQHTSAQQGRDDNNHNGEHHGSAPIYGKRNLIFMVSDGMGPTSLSLTRSWRQYVEQLPWDAPTLLLDKHLIGQSRTRSSSSLVTDSAAGATAFSCGAKSYNGAISVLPDYSPCGSVMEAAKRSGYTTGLVVTTRITDATPAVFVSHVRMRSMEDDIARQLIGETHPLGRMVDLVFGGGRCHFVGNETEREDDGESCRADSEDVLQTAQKSGWDYISDRKHFDALQEDAKLPLLGLFAPRDIPYEIDRRFEEETYPSLEQMTRTALSILEHATRDTEQGFFVMIEGSRIDHAGHANDPAAQVHEVQAYDRAVAVVMDFIRDSAVPTLMVGTSDHETGGLAVARQLHAEYPEYLWYPSVLADATHSAAWTAHQYHLHLSNTTIGSLSYKERPRSALKAYLKNLLSGALGIDDPTTSELELLISDPDYAAYALADMVSRRAQIGWSTHGHSGADVNIYTSNISLAGHALRGNHENIEVGVFLREFLGVGEEVEKVTAELRKFGKSGVDEDGDEEDEVMMEKFLGPVPPGSQRLDGQDHFEHYSGDHRRLKKRSGAHEGCGCEF